MPGRMGFWGFVWGLVVVLALVLWLTFGKEA